MYARKLTTRPKSAPTWETLEDHVRAKLAGVGPGPAGTGDHRASRQGKERAAKAGGCPLAATATDMRNLGGRSRRAQDGAGEKDGIEEIKLAGSRAI